MWCEYAGSSAGRGRDMEAVGGEPGDDAVVDDEPGLVEHEAVAAATRLELQPAG